jgi:hypothetical protein
MPSQKSKLLGRKRMVSLQREVSTKPLHVSLAREGSSLHTNSANIISHVAPYATSSAPLSVSPYHSRSTAQVPKIHQPDKYVNERSHGRVSRQNCLLCTGPGRQHFCFRLGFAWNYTLAEEDCSSSLGIKLHIASPYDKLTMGERAACYRRRRCEASSTTINSCAPKADQRVCVPYSWRRILHPRCRRSA